MKCLGFFILMLITASNCLGQDLENNTLPNELNSSKTIRENKIDSSIVTITYKKERITRYFVYDTLGNPLKITSIDKDGYKIGEFLFTYNYNDVGQIIERSEKEKTGLKRRETKTFSVYDDKGREIRNCILNLLKGDTIVTVSRYTDKETIHEILVRKVKMFVQTEKNDENNKVVEIGYAIFDRMGNEGKEGLIKAISYDEKGNIALEVFSYPKMDSSVYKYDKANKLISVQKRKSIEKYFYNELGLVKKILFSNLPIEDDEYYSSEYRYIFRN